MSEITAVVIAYNEEALLPHTLPPIKAVSERVVIVDMGSTDGSRDIYNELLAPDDLVLNYPRECLFSFGFAHPRNFGAKRAKTDWILAVDCDEYIDVDQFLAAKQMLRDTKSNVFSIDRINYQSQEGLSLDDISGIFKNAPSTSEGHRRLYRNIPRIRWEGMIHEELWISEINAYYDCEAFPASLGHFNQFKQNSEHFKFGLYSYLTFQAIEYPALRYGTNEHWFSVFPQQHLGIMVHAANDFAAVNGLTPVREVQVRAQLAKDGFAPLESQTA
jgi:glycosyltransferase involved in cell wall biosynthesis